MTGRDSSTNRLSVTTFLVLLTCGCKARMRDVPRYEATLSCQSGQKHGHRLRWVEAVRRDGLTLTNDRVKSGELT
jgi:hypothetical protein